MIAVDSSSFIAFLKGDIGWDIERVFRALENEELILPPIVVAEMFSNHRLPENLVDYIKALPVLPLLPEFWRRAGMLRAGMLSKKLKARLADTLIAQCCIDHHIPLITRDSDFRHFVEHGDLILLSQSTEPDQLDR